MIRPLRLSQETMGWTLLIPAALLLRLWGLGHRAMSHDESLHALYSWYLSNGLNYRHDPMMHGPLLFHLNGLVYTLLPVNDFTARLLPALWGSGCVALLYVYRRWLGRLGAFLAAVFLCLEPAHLFYSRYVRNDITVSFFTLLMVWAILRYRESRKPFHLIWLAVALAFQFVTKETCYIHGAVLGSGCVIFAAWQSRNPEWKVGCTHLLRHPLLHCALLMLCLSLPFAGTLLHPLLGWDPLNNRDPVGQKRILGIALSLYFFSTLAGSLYFQWQKQLRAFALSMLAFWSIQITLYSTLFTNWAHGLASGLAGGLGYWLAQHGVKRGNPDPFFYVTLLLLYAPVLLLAAALAWRQRRHLPIAFLLYWLLANLLIFSWAGERMPWLLVHLTLPLCLLAGMSTANVFKQRRGFLLKTLLVLGCVHLTANSLRLNGPLSEGPWEPLTYAHSGPDIKPALEIIEAHLDRDPDNRILVDNRYSWPMAWYLRDRNVDHHPAEPANIQDNTVAILAPGERVTELEASGWAERMRVDMTTWPRPHYHRISRKNLRNLLQNPAIRRKFIRYYFFRDQPEWGPREWPGPNRFVLMTRQE
ncbi:MAG: flippase activity-associated protein Agl23 [Kiritimatiellia bacterium]